MSSRTGVSGKEGLAYFRKAYNLEVEKVESAARREQLKIITWETLDNRITVILACTRCGFAIDKKTDFVD